MKKINKILVAILMVLAVGGCNNSKNSCECPNDNNDENKVETTLINGYSKQYQETAQSVVMVEMRRLANNELRSTGSGVVFFEEGKSAYIITNAHVLKDYTSSGYIVEVYFSDNKGVQTGKSEKATVAGVDYYEDVAVLEIDKSDKYKVAKLGDSNAISKSEGIYTIGSPLQIFNHTTDGVISNYNYEIAIDMINSGKKTNVYAILTDAPINNGNSGGGLFNSKGELIGITTFKYNTENKMAESLVDQNTSLTDVYGSLPINHVVKVAKHLLSSTEAYKRPNLSGLTLLSVNTMGSDRTTHEISSNIFTGVYVKHSTEASIPYQTIITKINGVTVNSKEEFMVQVLEYNIGDTVTLTLINSKDGMNEQTVNVTLHE